MKNLLLRSIGLLTVLSLMGILLACPNGDKIADKIFKTNGMNRLRVVSTRIKTSGVILSKNNQVSYIGEIADWSGGTAPTFNLSEEKVIIAGTNANTSVGTDVKLQRIPQNSNTNMNPSIAMNFLNDFLPVSASGKIQFAGAVKIDQIDAKDYAIKVSDVVNFVEDQALSQTFLRNMRRFSDAGYKVFIVYDVLKSDKLKLVTVSNSEISANANINKIYDIGAGFSYVKSSNTTLDFSGSTLYAFAIRSLHLKKNGNAWRIEPGTYSGTGLGGDEERYSISPIVKKEDNVVNDFPTLDLAFDIPTTP